MNFENIISVLGLLGLGGVLGTYFRILWERKNTAQLQKQEFKESRYKCIIILMLSLLDFEKSKTMLHQHGRSYINSIEDLKDELNLEWNNMFLFASSEVLERMYKFIEKPSQDNFRKVALAMRRDLWGGKISSQKLEELKKSVTIIGEDGLEHRKRKTEGLKPEHQDSRRVERR